MPPEQQTPNLLPSQQNQPTQKDNNTDEAHRAEACTRLSPIGQKLFKFIEFDAQEQLIAEIRKHPIGLVFIALTGGFISIVVALSSSLLAANLENLGLGFESNLETIKTIIFGLGMVISMLALVATFIIAYLYKSNVVFVTSDKIAEVVYKSLFNREVTQLGMGSVENVSITQKGILPRIFDYGTLLVETAGELQNITLTLIPNPNHYSQLIIQAHEESVKRYGN